jgi:glyoxylase-like metal-dependent hydrolase (beta-lactamase superfamily II)
MEFFPDAEVVVEERSADLIDSGAAEAQLRGALDDWGNDLPIDIRYDRTIKVGERFTIGNFGITVIDAAGHMMDGAAYVFENEKLLAPGDFICDSMCPLAWWSVGHSRETLGRLVQALDDFEIDYVVPGHGSVLDREAARRVAQTDLEYFKALEAAVREAKQADLSWADSMVKLLKIPVPRPSEPDIEIYSPAVMNAKRALIERGTTKPGEEPPVWGM